ncbi:hypothetical protein [Mesobacterium pallidum]|uniref:hypothetical protein n=1 Tax=Mesobacterium pallidum TaxID=2872037 RepID=UPI001EE338BE|nr:hypothetical protein [Mesobacterium pallidum]
MLRCRTLCLFLTTILLQALLPVQAGATAACSGNVTISDVCAAPGTAAPTRTAAEKPCLTCVVPVGAQIPLRAAEQTALAPAPVVAPRQGRVIRPDRRPPRV